MNSNLISVCAAVIGIIGGSLGTYLMLKDRLVAEVKSQMEEQTRVTRNYERVRSLEEWKKNVDSQLLTLQQRPFHTHEQAQTSP